MAKTPNAIPVKKINPTVLNFAKLVQKQGGLALLVGGSVRDLFLNKNIVDFDIEVHELPAAKVKAVAKKFSSKFFEVGKSFGVLKLIKGKTEIDVSLPRHDSKISRGHRGFSVNTDPFMGIKEAARRRDFTVNSIALNPLTGELHDPFGGVKDLKNKILRVVDHKTFAEDPLRVLRGMQLAARFQLTLDKASLKAFAKALPEIKYLSRDRIWQEWRKLLLSTTPSYGLELAMQTGLIKKYHPELAAMPATPQHLIWHPEGNVWNHTKLAADKAAEIAREKDLSEEETLTLVLASITHDFGKPLVTRKVNGIWRAHGHSQAGVGPTREFLKRIGTPKQFVSPVVGLVLAHMRPHTLFFESKRPTAKALNKLARDLAEFNTTIGMLALLNLADFWGVGDKITKAKASELKAYTVFNKKLVGMAEVLKITKSEPADIVRGRDLIKLGLKPGPHFGKFIKEANRLHEEKGYTKEKILKILKKYV